MHSHYTTRLKVSIRIPGNLVLPPQSRPFRRRCLAHARASHHSSSACDGCCGCNAPGTTIIVAEAWCGRGCTRFARRRRRAPVSAARQFHSGDSREVGGGAQGRGRSQERGGEQAASRGHRARENGCGKVLPHSVGPAWEKFEAWCARAPESGVFQHPSSFSLRPSTFARIFDVLRDARSVRGDTTLCCCICVACCVRA